MPERTPPRDEVEVFLRQERADITDSRGHDPREEHPARREPFGEPPGQRSHEHPGEHEQRDRKPEQELLRYNRVRRAESDGEQRQKRARQLLGEHEDEQWNPDLHGVAQLELGAAGKPIAIVDVLSGSLNPVLDALVDLGVDDLAHLEAEVFVALPQPLQRTVEGGNDGADFVARPHREASSELAPRTLGENRLDALHRRGDPYAHEEQQEFQRHEQRDHDDGGGLVHELGQPAAHVFSADAHVQHGDHAAVAENRERAVDEAVDLGHGARLAVGGRQTGQDSFQQWR